MKSIIDKFKKIISKETINYAIAGVLTTVINMGTYYVFSEILDISKQISNIIAWVVAVTFAYVANNKFVFDNEFISAKVERTKIIKFFGARLVSLPIEQLGIYIFIDVLHYNNMIVKAAISIIVIVLNYIFSKLFIFNKKAAS